MSRYLKLLTAISVITAIAVGIWYLEEMRKASAAERRAAEAAALEAARKAQQPP